MHFDFLPRVTHNEDAVREFERDENRRVRRWVLRLIIALLVVILLGWLLLHFNPGLAGYLVSVLSPK